MKLTITINTQSAIFEDTNQGKEIARILRQLAGYVDGEGNPNHTDNQVLCDINGNQAGKVEFLK